MADGVIDVAAVAERLEAARERIAGTGVDPERVSVLAVTKGHGVEAVDAAVAVGLGDVGENYGQEAVAKHDERPDAPVRWHMIGNVQTNKVRMLAPFVELWQTVDRGSLVQELSKRAPGAAVLVQVNVSGEETKRGVEPDGVAGLVERADEAGLEVRGLMTIAEAAPPEVVGPQFARLRGLVDRLGLAECSMGMSGDLEVAVAEGATMVRLGTALFGPRPSVRSL
ncbi:MAG: YggS family pyridoxal phosphate-dependent enzyme [Actinomycetota bacterium]